MKVFIDGDSIAYAAGYCEHPAEMELTCDVYMHDILTACQTNEHQGFVETPDGKSNFRKWVACTRIYKGNRRGREKPPWLVEAKHYLRDKHGFKWVMSMESEDACSICAHQLGLDKSYIAAIDKDLHQIPATFYDYKKKKWDLISVEQANYNLYSQILTGDSVDNIPGIPGMGPAKAGKQLSFGDGVEKLALDCAKAYKDAGFPYAYLMEQSRLIYILRKRGDVFTPVTREAWELL